MGEADSPRVSFLIGGVQKAGTTALASFLGLHHGVRLPRGKEAHVFDAPDFDDAWSSAEVDARYAAHFEDVATPVLTGDATPIYCLHERFIARIRRYNPAMRWILLLRDPVERAISQYHMERDRGNERWPLWAALLCERWRLRGHLDDFSAHSPLRTHGYRLRGDYARQLDVLYRYFPADQVLVLQSATLRENPARVLVRVYEHLGLPQPVKLPDDIRVFEGEYTPLARSSPTRWLAAWLLWPARRRLRRRHGVTFS
ncbi:MAG: sulfotransferase [Proteobacteria bacterium]|nr:sulfotransferase [Pseudomonadota bacterium]